MCTIITEVIPVENILQKMREACQEAKSQQKENARLEDVVLNTITGDFIFVWKEEEK